MKSKKTTPQLLGAIENDKKRKYLWLRIDGPIATFALTDGDAHDDKAAPFATAEECLSANGFLKGVCSSCHTDKDVRITPIDGLGRLETVSLCKKCMGKSYSTCERCRCWWEKGKVNKKRLCPMCSITGWLESD